MLLTACGAVDKNEKGVVITNTNAGYEIEKIDGEYYLVFKDEKYKNTVNASQEAPSLEFSSVAEMKDKILNGKLSEDEKFEMSTFSKDRNGKIQVCSFERMYQPVLPSDVILVDMVVWDGMNYYPYIQSDSFSYSTIAVQTKSAYDAKYKRTKDMIHNNDLVVITETIKIDDRDASVYQFTTSAGKLKCIEYTIATEKGKIHVFEYCFLNLSAFFKQKGCITAKRCGYAPSEYSLFSFLGGAGQIQA